MTHEKDRPYDYLATSLISLNLFSICIYYYLKQVNSLSCKDYKLLKTHKKLFLEKINSYLEKIDEIKSNYNSIFKAEVSGKTRCCQECMVINYGKLIPEASLSAKIKKTIQENSAI